MYECDKCGSCCKNLFLNPIYKDLDRGDGCCKHLDLESNLCTIYYTRPNICNIKQMYIDVFYDQYSEEEYIKINKKYCKELRGR